MSLLSNEIVSEWGKSGGRQFLSRIKFTNKIGIFWGLLDIVCLDYNFQTALKPRRHMN